MALRRFGRYLVFQVPGWVLAFVTLGIFRAAFDASMALVSILFVVWVVKDLAVYPWVRDAYDPDTTPVVMRLVGLPGVAIGEIRHEGWVRVRGELWRATSERPIAAGRSVTVTSVRDGRVLVVD